MRTNVPIAMRVLRARRRWRQQDLGARAALSRDAVSRAETGHLDGITIGSLQRLTKALDASLVVDIRYQGAELDRLVDRAHAMLQEAAARRLSEVGWLTRAEVSFNHYGDRGSCDILALHPSTRMVMVVEVKSRLGNIQETLHRVDVKGRLARAIVGELGWPAPAFIARALVLPDDRTSRRVIHAHAALFGGFELRGRAALAWLRRPGRDATGVLWFETPADSGQRRTATPRRVMKPRGAG
jgi:DNA-binding Xre family transcriptional regulator